MSQTEDYFDALMRGTVSNYLYGPSGVGGKTSNDPAPELTGSDRNPLFNPYIDLKSGVAVVEDMDGRFRTVPIEGAQAGTSAGRETLSYIPPGETREVVHEWIADPSTSTGGYWARLGYANEQKPSEVSQFSTGGYYGKSPWGIKDGQLWDYAHNRPPTEEERLAWEAKQEQERADAALAAAIANQIAQGQLDLARAKFVYEQGHNKILDRISQRAQDVSLANNLVNQIMGGAQALLPYTAPAGTSADLAAINNAIAGGYTPGGFQPRTGEFPFDPYELAMSALRGGMDVAAESRIPVDVET